MPQRKKAVFNWSGGKDSALALQKVLQSDELEVVALLTTINEETLTSSVHSIPIGILSKQAESIGIPLHTTSFAKNLSDYNEKMHKTVEHFKKQKVTHFIFGDIFLADVKKHREKNLNPLGIEVVEPLWNKSPAEVMNDFLKSGIKAKIIVTQADKLDKNFIGKDLNADTVSSFPDNIDICGENGEYHTLAYAGSLFRKDIEFAVLNIIQTTYDIGLSSGQTKNFAYWQAETELVTS